MKEEQMIAEVRALNDQIERLEARKHDLLLAWGQQKLGDKTAAEAERDFFEEFIRLNDGSLDDSPLAAALLSGVLEYLRTRVQPDSPAILWIAEYEKIKPILTMVGDLFEEEEEIDEN